MKIADDNILVRYEFTPEEMIEGCIFTSLQLARLKNLGAMLTQARLNEVPDANNYAAFLQVEAAYKGRLDIIEQLIRESQEAELERTRASLRNGQPEE